MHVYRLRVKKDSQSIEYATIIEVHHSDYMTYRQLRRLFAVDAGEAPTSSELVDWRTMIVKVDG